MELAISTAAGESASLADASEFKDLLEFMLEESATSVFLSSETVGRNDPDDALIDALSPGFTVQAEAFGWTEEQQTELKDKIIPDNLPLPFDGYALGTVWNGFGFNTIIAYAYPSETAASDGYLSMERHFDNKRVQIDERLYRDAFGVSVTVEGRIIAVRLGRNVGYGLIDSLQEPIFIHE